MFGDRVAGQDLLDKWQTTCGRFRWHVCLDVHVGSHDFQDVEEQCLDALRLLHLYSVEVDEEVILVCGSFALGFLGPATICSKSSRLVEELGI